MFTCYDRDNGNELASTVGIGSGELQVTGPDGFPVPNGIQCTVSDSGGTIVQAVGIRTDGKSDLFLKDTYGLFELQACQVDNNIKNLYLASWLHV